MLPLVLLLTIAITVLIVARVLSMAMDTMVSCHITNGNCMKRVRGPVLISCFENSAKILRKAKCEQHMRN